MYSEAQLKAISRELRNKVNNGEVQPYEVVITLLVMERTGDVNAAQIKDVLLSVLTDKIAVLQALDKALSLVDDQLISAILKDLNKSTK